ncbi:MAG: hypothetical protein A3F78_22535 [Burkholderiales bacterium RIFCSPLOWO2_12_FULL_61_40]|nr:MAG: hypothetical protein A3F78_22535 [Burkholderiales bacterium RIFCSPLOWO2_12_FULL_61_40]
MYTSDTTQISETGLRYTAKENGSPFQGMGGSGEVRSCMRCGKHKLRSNGTLKRFLNSVTFFCLECWPDKSAPSSGNVRV